MADTDEDETAKNKVVKIKAMVTFNAELSKKKPLTVSKVEGKFVVTGDYSNLAFAIPISFQDFDFTIFKTAGTMNSHMHRERILEITKDVSREVFTLMLAISAVCPKKSRVLTFFQSAAKAKTIKQKEEVIKALKSMTVEYPRQEKEDKFSLQTLASAFASQMLMFSVLIHRSDNIEHYYSFDYMAQMAITDEIGKEVKKALFEKWSAYGPSKNAGRDKNIAVGFIEQYFLTRYSDSYALVLPDGTVFTDKLLTKELFKEYVNKVLSFSKSSGMPLNAAVTPVTKSTRTLMLEAELSKAKVAEKSSKGFQGLMSIFSTANAKPGKAIATLEDELAASIKADQEVMKLKMEAEIAAVEAAAQKEISLQTLVAVGKVPLITSELIETATSSADAVSAITEEPAWLKEMEAATGMGDRGKIDSLISNSTDELSLMSRAKGKYMLAAAIADQYFYHILSTVGGLEKVQVLYENLISDNAVVYKVDTVMPVMAKLFETFNQLDFNDEGKFLEFEAEKRVAFDKLASLYGTETFAD